MHHDALEFPDSTCVLLTSLVEGQEATVLKLPAFRLLLAPVRGAYWRGDAEDSGHITEISWDAVAIAWDNGHVATVHHGDMREIQRAPTKRATV